MKNTQYSPLDFKVINRTMGKFNHLPKPDLPILKVNTTPSGKRTYTTPEGLKYPSITTVLGDQEKPWLDDWRKSLGREKADKETKRAGERGDAVHKLSELYLNNTLDSNVTRHYKPEYVNQFNKVKMYLNKIDNIRIQEAGIYSDVLKVAGRVDCIGEYRGVLSIVDFKTSSNVKDKEMIADYILQCTGYSLCFFEQTGIFIDNYVIIMSVEKGMAPLIFQGKITPSISKFKQRITQFYEKMDNK